MDLLSSFDVMSPFGDDSLIALLVFSAGCLAALIGVVVWSFGDAVPDPYLHPFGEMPTIDRRTSKQDAQL